MKPASLSATALHVAELCLARYNVEHLGKVSQPSKKEATIGSTVHEALENFVRAVYLKKKAKWEDEFYLAHLLKEAYVEHFNSADPTTPEFEECQWLVSRWYHRTDLSSREVLMVENKLNFPIPTSIGEIPFNYIFDRLDRIQEGVYEVTDYKTGRWPVNHDQLENKIQSRAYALAARIMYPDAEKIWVTFDMLRFDAVGLAFTKDDNAEFWYQLKRAAQRIVDAPVDVEPTINAECRWCPIKARCPELNKNVSAGGIHSLTPPEAARLKYDTINRIKALESLNDDLEVVLMEEMKQMDDFGTVEMDGLKVGVTASKRRKPNNAAIAEILGPKLTADMGKFTLKDIDNLIKSGRLTDEQIAAIYSEIPVTFGEPRIFIKPPKEMEDASPQ